MKRILLILAAIVLVSACTSSLPGRITRLANKVESHGANYSSAQWEKTNAQFQKLLQEYVDNYDKFNTSQKKEINKAIALYGKAALKAGVTGVSNLIDGVLSEIPNAVDDLIEGARGFLDGLGL